MKTVVVIGGGITGVSAMYHLQKWKKANSQDLRLILIEASTELGGKIRTVRDGNFTMEAGADSIVSRKPNIAPLIEELNLQNEVVYNATGTSFIHTDGELKQIPEDAVFGIPTSLESLAKSTLISDEGKVEALKDFYTENTTFQIHDSIGLFLEHFLGKELVEKQISPVLSGVYSGKLSDLTIASTLPYLLDYKNKYGSIIKGLAENKKTFQGTTEKKFLSFKDGLSTLIDRFEEKMIDVEILKGISAEKIEMEQARYLITLDNQEVVEADFVVLGIPHTAAQNVLDDVELDKEFNQLKNSSLISIYLGFDIPDSELPKDGTGFIVGGNSELTCNACTWTSRKWEHTSTKHQLLVRLFYKTTSPVYKSLRNSSKEELIQHALKDVQNGLGITGVPVTSEVTNWSDKMPNYHINHKRIVTALEEKLTANYPNLILAGCSYYGVGVPDCISNGEKTAQMIVSKL